MRHPPSPSPFPDPLQREYLITIWRTRQEPITQTLLCEIARLHEVIRKAEGYRVTIAAELSRQGDGQLVAAHQLRVLLSAEPALLKPNTRPGPLRSEPCPILGEDPPFDPNHDVKFR